jgi:amidophosphoribosyltransferase
MILPLIEAVRGQDIVVVDDSIVRGISSKQIVRYLKNAGAKKISFLSTFPPITYPCYAGIDFPTKKDLVAYQASNGSKSIEDINKGVADIIQTDLVGYNDVKGLCDGIGLPESELCISCVTGDYKCFKKMPHLDERKLKK